MFPRRGQPAQTLEDLATKDGDVARPDPEYVRLYSEGCLSTQPQHKGVIAAVALPAATAEEVGGYYEFTGACEIGEFEEYSKLTLYGFVGCPHTKNKDTQRTSAERMVKPYFYVTREYAALPAMGGKRNVVRVALQAPLRPSRPDHGSARSARDQRLRRLEDQGGPGDRASIAAAARGHRH